MKKRGERKWIGPGFFQRIIRRLTQKSRHRRAETQGQVPAEESCVDTRDDTTSDSEPVSFHKTNKVGDEGTPSRYFGTILHNFCDKQEDLVQVDVECGGSKPTQFESEPVHKRPQLKEAGFTVPLEEFCSKNIPLPRIVKFCDGHTSLSEELSIGADDMMIVMSKEMEDVARIATQTQPSTYSIPVHTNVFQVIPAAHPLCCRSRNHACKVEEMANSEQLSPGSQLQPYVVRTRGTCRAVCGQVVPDGSVLFVWGVVHKKTTIKDVTIPVLLAKTERGTFVEILLGDLEDQTHPTILLEFHPAPLSLAAAIDNFKLPLVCSVEGANEEMFCSSVVVESVEKKYVVRGFLKDSLSEIKIEEEIAISRWRMELPADPELSVVIMTTGKVVEADSSVDTSDDEYVACEGNSLGTTSARVIGETHVVEQMEPACKDVDVANGIKYQHFKKQKSETITARDTCISDSKSDSEEETENFVIHWTSKCPQAAAPLAELPQTSASLHSQSSQDSTTVQVSPHPLIHANTGERKAKHILSKSKSMDCQQAYRALPPLDSTQRHPCFESTSIAITPNPAYVVVETEKTREELALCSSRDHSRDRPLPPLPKQSSTSLQSLSRHSDVEDHDYVNCDACSILKNSEAGFKPRRWNSYKEFPLDESTRPRSRGSVSFRECTPEDIDQNLECLKALTTSDISKLLDAMNLGLYRESFRKEHINGALMSQLDEDMLKEIGVSSRLHRLRIMNVVQGSECVDFIFRETNA